MVRDSAIFCSSAIAILLISVVNAQQLLSNSRCNHYPERGTCEREFTVKWYYDRYDHRCRRFFYGGCDGNENRFDTLEECSSQCSYQEPSNRDRCFQSHDPGHCSSDIERWYFDQDKKQCVCSWWSGCGGNSNIYYSYNHCMLICGDYAENGPGIDEKYWNRHNNHTMSIESQNVFNNPYPVPNQNGFFLGDPYSVQMPVDNEPGHFLDQTQFITINISHIDDGPQYLHAKPVSTNPLMSDVARAKSNGVTIHRYDSEPRLLREMDLNPPSNNWKIQEQPATNQFKRRFKIQKKKTPPRMIHVNPAGNSNENAYKIKLENNFSPIPNQNSQNSQSYQVVRAQDATVVQHHKIAEALQNEAEETQKRIQESLRRNYYEQQLRKQQQMHAARMNQQMNPNLHNQHQTPAVPAQTTDPDAEMVNQFKSHLEDHERSLRQKLEAQFPDHVITLIPQIETVRHPDGRNVVRQRIQWTAHPKSQYNQQPQPQQPQQPQRNTNYNQNPNQIYDQSPNQNYNQNQIPHHVPNYGNSNTNNNVQYPTYPPIETTTETIEFITTVATPVLPVETTVSPIEIARIKHEEIKKKHQEEMERRRLEHLKKLKEHQENQERERQRVLKEREDQEKERRRQYEEELRKIKTTTTQTPTTAVPVVKYPYPTIPVRNNIVYDANVQTPQPTSKSSAVPLDHYRPIIEHVTAVPLSIDDIIAMGDEKSDYEEEYDVPMDFPDTEAPPITTTTRRPVVTQPRPAYTPPTQAGMMPIVLPPTSGTKKSKLFSAISSEEYTQDIDFDPYVDFVM